ncbi:hypothetical protein CVT25_009988 [Psilocybe cyanescens]|uniref:Aminoglycoside phosphotransferase domain-containing protein n=1 Tax=Psilocybe cyanescens TaxID=93625 RepID=A0A409XGQ4_PSICY|nr:hypothetical protein CVT25_009988 [Psilocybe cyanescens]
MPTDIRISILGGPGTGRTTLCQRLNEYVYLRLSDGHRFRFLAQEADMNASGLMNESDAILLTFGLDTDFGDLINQYGKLVRHNYWEHRKAFYVIGTKQDSLEHNSDYVRYPGRLTTMITLFTSIDSAIVGALRGNGIEELCCSVVPPDVNKDTPDSVDLPAIPDDNTAWTMCDLPEAVAYNRRLADYSNSIFKSAPTWKIAPTLILKRLDPSERFNNIFVRAHTNIPVPQPRYLHLKKALITDFIPGSMLLACWDSLSAFYQFRIACTLRRYVSQMRRITSERPGSIDRGLVKGHLFEPDLWNGPFRDVETFRNWIQHIAYTGWIRSDSDESDINASPSKLKFPPKCDWTPVLTHCDLSLGNVMLSDDGILWVIDWAYSGFYPPWLESMGMRRYDHAPESWKQWYWFITGSSSEINFIWSHFMKAVATSASDLPRDDYWPSPV